MREELNLEEIESRCEKATPGPWMWNLNLKSRRIALEAQISGFEIVMDFARWGFGSACPRFQQHLSGCGGIMHMAHEMAKVVENRRHHSDWYQTIEHPDANFIAHARTDVPKLIAEVRRLRDWVNDLQSGMWINCVYCGHRYGPKDKVPCAMSEVLKQHIEQCPEHPMSKLKAEIERLRDWQTRAAETLSLAHGIVDDYQLETWERKDVVPFASLSKQCAQLLSELEGRK